MFQSYVGFVSTQLVPNSSLLFGDITSMSKLYILAHPSHFSPKFWGLINIPINEQIAMGISKEQIPPLGSIPAEPNPHRELKHNATDRQPSTRKTKLARIN